MFVKYSAQFLAIGRRLINVYSLRLPLGSIMKALELGGMECT